MKKRIGLVQTRGIGDIIIALPIADFFIEQGYDVFWPIETAFIDMFRRAKPEINFLPVQLHAPKDYDYFLNDPVRLLRENECERIIVLYSHIGTINLPDTRLSTSMKFDEYKYAVAQVPFERKWKLNYERDLAAEERLYESLEIDGEYACVHDLGSAMKEPLEIPPELTRGLRVIRVSPLTDSVFDWRLTFERASKLVMVNSCFANFVEQLNLTNEKAFYAQFPVQFTPVFINNWKFVFSKTAG